jgi:hypothetical protein
MGSSPTSSISATNLLSAFLLIGPGDCSKPKDSRSGCEKRVGVSQASHKPPGGARSRVLAHGIEFPTCDGSMLS